MKSLVFAVVAATTVTTTTASALPIPRCEMKIECGVSFPR